MEFKTLKKVAAGVINTVGRKPDSRLNGRKPVPLCSGGWSTLNRQYIAPGISFKRWLLESAAGQYGSPSGKDDHVLRLQALPEATAA